MNENSIYFNSHFKIIHDVEIQTAKILLDPLEYLLRTVDLHFFHEYLNEGFWIVFE